MTDSWIRNIHFRNADFGVEFDDAERVTIINLYFTHFINRPAFVEAAFYIRTAAYLGIGMGKMHKCLIHNIHYTGDMFHDFDIINVPSYNVISQVHGTSVELRHHSIGANHNLYTDVHCGKGFGPHGLDDTRGMNHETHWGIHRKDRNVPDHPDAGFLDAMGNYHVFVGNSIDYNTTITDTFYYENIDPALLTPSNIYLAQIEYNNKILPEASFPTPPLPPELTGDVRRLNPTDDVAVGQDPEALSIPFDGYLKFNLSDLTDLSSIFRATLKVSTKGRTTTMFTMSVSSVADDVWTQESLTTGPAPGASLDSVYVDDSLTQKWWSLDVTSFVQQEWAGDKIVSLYVSNNKPGNFLGGFHTKESGNAPILVIERVADPVPGPPLAPTGMVTFSENGHILLDWDDNTEADFAYYNVYRNPAPNADHPIAQGLTMSEFADISATEDRGLCEMPSNVLYYYTITAVDKHGYESERSAQFIGNTLSTINLPPSFSSNTTSLPDAIEGQSYSTSIATAAGDPDSDPLYFFKVSGPAWLNIAFDGTITGNPPNVGTFQIVVQVNAFGGRDAESFILNVTEDPDATETPTNAPTTLSPTEAPTKTQPPTEPLSCSELGYSNKDCAELGFAVDISGKVDSLDICGDSKFAGTCFPSATTWLEAKNSCESIGARLCTKDEIVGYETTQTGCGYDSSMIWSSTECEPGKYYTPKGQGNIFGMGCTSASDATVAVRCCGDVTLPCAPSQPTPTSSPVTAAPLDAPTKAPTTSPTAASTTSPTSSPVTAAPLDAPTKAPTTSPTAASTPSPTKAPTNSPTKAPTTSPTKAPSKNPTVLPTVPPTFAPTTNAPTAMKTAVPTTIPTPSPTVSSNQMGNMNGHNMLRRLRNGML